MKNKLVNCAVETIDTTIGELIEAVTSIALESGKSEKEGYELASITLERILNNPDKGLELLN